MSDPQRPPIEGSEVTMKNHEEQCPACGRRLADCNNQPCIDAETEAFIVAARGPDAMAALQARLAEQAQELARLTEELALDRAVCLCGCAHDVHETYGDEGESCGNDTHECIRVAPAVLSAVTLLRQQLAAQAQEIARLTKELARAQQLHDATCFTRPKLEAAEREVSRLMQAASETTQALEQANNLIAQFNIQGARTLARAEAAEQRLTALTTSARALVATLAAEAPPWGDRQWGSEVAALQTLLDAPAQDVKR